ncbi:MAG: hypothetical protein HKN23_00070, partial [Verrucomicrobiales bacterium]|nr:hypothetical protein [Verrucomicrobiales bacterium]
MERVLIVMRKIGIGIGFFALVCGMELAAEEIEYQKGFDPEAARPEGIAEIPETAWGQQKKGLQAAITGPEKVKFNERSKFYFVVRNVSEKSIRATFRSQAIHPYIMPEGAPTATGGYSNHNGFVRFEISPGHQFAIPFPEITVVRGDGIAPTHAKENLEPGRHFITVRMGAGGENWGRFSPGEKIERIEYADGEWLGGITAKPYGFEILDEDIALEIPVPEELGKGKIDPKPSIERPESINHEGPGFEFRS